MQFYKLANEYACVVIGIQGSLEQQSEAESIFRCSGDEYISLCHGDDDQLNSNFLDGIDALLLFAGQDNVSHELNSLLNSLSSQIRLSILFVQSTEKNNADSAITEHYPFNTIVRYPLFSELVFAAKAIAQLIVNPMIVGIDFSDILTCFPAVGSRSALLVHRMDWVQGEMDEKEILQLTQALEKALKPDIKNADSILISFSWGLQFELKQWADVMGCVNNLLGEQQSICCVSGVSIIEEINAEQAVLIIFITQHPESYHQAPVERIEYVEHCMDVPLFLRKPSEQ